MKAPPVAASEALGGCSFSEAGSCRPIYADLRPRGMLPVRLSTISAAVGEPSPASRHAATRACKGNAPLRSACGASSPGSWNNLPLGPSQSLRRSPEQSPEQSLEQSPEQSPEQSLEQSLAAPPSFAAGLNASHNKKDASATRVVPPRLPSHAPDRWAANCESLSVCSMCGKGQLE